MKQTAVTWLEEQFIWMIEDGVDWADAFHSVMAKIEQAKQMEEKQIRDAYCKGVNQYEKHEEGHKINWEQYYNETYINEH